MDADACEICKDIPDFASADLRDGQRLPDAVSRLVDGYPAGFWDTAKDYEIIKTCPLCGATYTGPPQRYQNAKSPVHNTYPPSSRSVTAWAMMHAPRLLV